MKTCSSTPYLLVMLCLISGGIFAIIASCDRHTMDSPTLGPAGGDTCSGGGETQQVVLSLDPSEPVIVVQGENQQVQVSIVARVENACGLSMPDGTDVIWGSTIGDLDPLRGKISKGVTSTLLTFPLNYSGCSTVRAISGDASISQPVCTEAQTPTPTPTPSPTPVPTCGGLEYANDCWYLGWIGQTCNEFCSLHGAAVTDGVLTYTGAEGTWEQCLAVASQLVEGEEIFGDYCYDSGLGCFIAPGPTIYRDSCGRTLPNALSPDIQRICSCTY